VRLVILGKKIKFYNLTPTNIILSPIKNRTRWLRPRISQWFGENYDFYAKLGSKNGHSGIDFAVPIGTPIHAPFDGMCFVDKTHENYGYNIRIKNDRMECILAHLSEFKVEHLDTVAMGDIVAHSGNTGLSSGPHLHFGVRHIHEDGRPLYPQNGNFGWEDLTEYIICWFRKLKD